MNGYQVRFAVVAFAAAGAVGACAPTNAAFRPLGMAEEPRLERHPWINPFYRRSFYQHGSRRLSSNSTIADICANPEGKAVIDRDLPGLTERPEYDFFKHMSLKTLKSMSRGKMTDEDVAKVDADLALLAPATETASLAR